MEFQGLLFGDDAEAQAQEIARRAALEQQKEYAEGRKRAWAEGKPFPEDIEKYYAAHRNEILARGRERHRITYPATAELHLRNSARLRAQGLGCKIGREAPMLKVYWRAVHADVALCYWCKKLTLPGERHVDHKRPLAAGGDHVAGNLCIACAECNLAKGDLGPDEYRRIIAEQRAANSLIAAEYFRSAAAALLSA